MPTVVFVIQDELGKLQGVVSSMPIAMQSLEISYERVEHSTTAKRVPVNLGGGIEAYEVTVLGHGRSEGQRDIYTITEVRVQEHADHL